MTVRIKICGFTRAADVDAAMELGVDACGFNFAAGPRRIEPAVAAPLVARVSPFAVPVGLFLNAAEEEILAGMVASGCRVIQLHGDAAPELAEALRRRFPVIRSFPIRDADSLKAVRDYPADAYLLDAHVSGLAGGTGTGWDHTLLAGQAFDRPVILAGGLTPANVATAIASTGVGHVDTASGVEAQPGVKSVELMRAFVVAARGG